MSSSAFWTRLARTALVRPRLGAPSIFRRSFVLLAAKPTSNAVLRSIPLIHRHQSSAASALVPTSEDSSEDVEVTDNEEKLPEFASLQGSVDPRVIRALTGNPFNLTTMSVVQAQVLPLLPGLAEPYDTENAPEHPRDLLVRAKTGTGKTLGFLIPVVEARLKTLAAQGKQAADSGLGPSKSLAEAARRRFAKSHTGAVIISPTRELATQIAQEANKLVRNIEGFGVHLLVGGESKGGQLGGFRRNAHDIIVATPGRLKDILDSCPDIAESVSHTQTLVLDEADSLLDMGFQPDLLAIQEYMPKSPERQTFLFSATISRAIRDIARASLAKRHTYINCVSSDHSPVHAHIPQYHTVLPSAEHQIPHVLRSLAHDQLIHPGKSKSIVFLPTTKMTMLFAEILKNLSPNLLPAGAHTTVYELHSKKSMESRTRASNRFRNDVSGASILITSDVSARGVDYPGVSRVIQVGIPSTGEQYVHRVGRTGRAGTQGRGDLVLLPWERGFVTNQLSQVELKPLTVQDLTTETLELAKAHDDDPATFFGGQILKVPTRSSMQNSRSMSFRKQQRTSEALFRLSIAPLIDDIPRAVTELLASADPEPIGETFTSLLGYYIGKINELKIRKTEVLDGCKDWVVQAGGMAEPPSLSKAFLDKLGFGNMDAMNRVRRDGFREPQRSSWAFKGRENFRGDGERGFGQRDGGGGFGGRREGGGSFGGRREGGGSFGGRRDGEGGFSRPRRDGDGGFGGARQRDGDGGFGRGRRDGPDDGKKQHWQGRGRVNNKNSGKSWDAAKNSQDDGGFKDHWNPF
ncbi:hypothetical protein Agabi119p4_9373 [Agaricus bisporus var. burnettii]|uniref:ATP-dependent RNA helicase n=1 Tax=Agaricus bisporus var. burnettii TaxID=192524 RepID=A0A8H7EWS4_AGABI|nr:hypothetical protein Agabi119p4_9373 [Agaricus bisporus var. burnettii]